MPAIQINQLSKFYGNTLGIERVSFEVNKGEVFGILGPNGAGKTTAIRTLLGLINATSGSAKILGQDALIPNTELRRRIGYLPGIAATYDRYTARKYLRFIAEMRGLRLDSKIEALAKRVDLSLVKSRGAAVVLSSHVLSEVEHLADRIAIFFQGRILIVDEISALKQRARHRIEFNFPIEIPIESFGRFENVTEIRGDKTRITCVVRGSQRELLKSAVDLGAVEVRTEETSLEEIFLDLIGAA